MAYQISKARTREENLGLWIAHIAKIAGVKRLEQDGRMTAEIASQYIQPSLEAIEQIKRLL